MLFGSGLASRVRILETAREIEIGTFRNSRIKKDPKRELFWIITSNSIEYLKDGKITNVETFPYNNNFDAYYDEFEKKSRAFDLMPFYQRLKRK